jgi:hypothetical protein
MNNVGEMSRSVFGFVVLRQLNYFLTKVHQGSPKHGIFNAFAAAVEKGFIPNFICNGLFAGEPVMR